MGIFTLSQENSEEDDSDRDFNISCHDNDIKMVCSPDPSEKYLGAANFGAINYEESKVSPQISAFARGIMPSSQKRRVDSPSSPTAANLPLRAASGKINK